MLLALSLPQRSQLLAAVVCHLSGLARPAQPAPGDDAEAAVASRVARLREMTMLVRLDGLGSPGREGAAA